MTPAQEEAYNPPNLAAIADQTAIVGEPMILTASVVDPDRLVDFRHGFLNRAGFSPAARQAVFKTCFRNFPDARGCENELSSGRAGD